MEPSLLARSGCIISFEIRKYPGAWEEPRNGAGVPRGQPCLRLNSGSSLQIPMVQERAEGRPRSESIPPRQDEEDQRAHDLARLHERIMTERLAPAFRVEGRRMEAPAVGRVEDDPRHLPDSIHEEVGRDAEADEPENPQPRCEARGEDGEQEDEGVRPDPRLEAEGIPKRLVNQVREDCTEQDEAIVEDGGRLPREDPGEPEADSQVCEQEHGTPSVASILTVAASRSIGDRCFTVSLNERKTSTATCPLAAASAREERMVGGIPIARIQDSERAGHGQ